MARKKLSSAEVVKMADISLRQLYYWEVKGAIKPTVIHAGLRSFKRYSERDVQTLKIVKELLDEGFTLRSAMERAKREMRLT